VLVASNENSKVTYEVRTTVGVEIPLIVWVWTIGNVPFKTTFLRPDEVEVSEHVTVLSPIGTPVDSTTAATPDTMSRGVYVWLTGVAALSVRTRFAS